MSTIVIGTIVFALLWVVAGILISIKASNSAKDPKLRHEYIVMSFVLTFLGAFCMWLMWVSVYMHQMYPLITPILKTAGTI